jgi:hypothetical protein
MLLWLFPILTACTTPKVWRVENQLLQRENTELRDKLAVCNTQAAPSDYLSTVDMEGVSRFIARAGYNGVEPVSDRILSIPIEGNNTSFRVNVQLFDRENVLFMVAAGYLELEAATSSKSMVLLLTQLAALNYEMLIGKFQLNPTTGAISLSAEINLDDGMGFQTFQSVLEHLIKTADTQHPTLLSAANGLGM